MSASDDYNALPFEIRKIASRVMDEHHLRDLRIERKRAVASHRRHLREIDAHIANVKRAITENDKDAAS